MRICTFIFFLLILIPGFTQTFEYSPNTKDTINYADRKGNRSGLWILLGVHKPRTCYHPNQVVETGSYSNNMRQGLWKEYGCNGVIKSEQVYMNGKVNGAVALYHGNGNLSARGTFQADHWVGQLELFDANGQLLYLISFDQ